MLLVAATAWGQIQSTDEVVMPTQKEQGSGALTPYFWVGAQAVSSLGYNLENGAFGIKSLGDDTWASFNFAMVSSKYDTPKVTTAGADPDIWSGRMSISNYTFIFNSWETAPEANKPLFNAEVQGKGLHFGILSQANAQVKAPATSIKSGGKVLYFADPDSLAADIYETINPNTKVEYAGDVMYAGYTKDNLFKGYLSFTSEGDVDTVKASDANGYAGVLDILFTPMGMETDMENPITVAVSASAIGGANYVKGKNPLGFGAKVVPSFYLADDFVLSPICAFEMKVPETGKSPWVAGGGLMLSLSAKRWVGASWGEDRTDVGDTWFKETYEHSKVLKYAYVQAYATYSDETDLDIAFKFEEPDGTAGFDENLGAMFEFRVNNVQEINTGKKQAWSTVGRVEYDLRDHTVTPYLRAYFNSEDVLKLRTGLHMSPIPHAGFELAYTSRNLNSDSKATGTSKPDYGRIEFIVIVKSDSGIISTPKRFKDWDY